MRVAVAETGKDDGTVANDARFSGGHRDCGLPDDAADRATVESPEYNSLYLPLNILI